MPKIVMSDAEDSDELSVNSDEYDTDDDKLDTLISLAELYGEEGRLQDALDHFKKAAEEEENEKEEWDSARKRYVAWDAEGNDHDLITKLLTRNGIDLGSVDDEDMYEVEDMLRRDRRHFSQLFGGEQATNGNKIRKRKKADPEQSTDARDDKEVNAT